MSFAVEADQLVKRFTGRSGTVEAVRGVDLRVADGEVFGFLGPNGAGKSTTVRMLTTLMTITSGSARVAGVDVTAEPDAARRSIGVALQEAGLDARQTGRELLILQARLFGSPPAAAADRAQELLELVDLVAAADRRVKGYSGGMKRRLDALKSRSAAATQSGSLVFFPLLFLTPNFVPPNLLTRPMEIAATFNPVTYIMEALRSLILDDLAWARIGRGFAVVAVAGVVMVALNVRTIRAYD